MLSKEITLKGKESGNQSIPSDNQPIDNQNKMQPSPQNASIEILANDGYTKIGKNKAGIIMLSPKGVTAVVSASGRVQWDMNAKPE
jgi:hypothetical protein